MNRNILVLSSSTVLVLGALACSSGGTGGTGGGTTSTTTTDASTGTGTSTSGTGGDPTPATSCVQKGEKGNDVGVGTYCTPGGGECSTFMGAPTCLADLGQDQWFCTKILCKVDSECGMTGVCHHDPQGSACVPAKCDSGTTSSTGTGAGGAGGGKGGGGAGGK